MAESRLIVAGRDDEHEAQLVRVGQLESNLHNDLEAIQLYKHYINELNAAIRRSYYKKNPCTHLMVNRILPSLTVLSMLALVADFSLNMWVSSSEDNSKEIVNYNGFNTTCGTVALNATAMNWNNFCDVVFNNTVLNITAIATCYELCESPGWMLTLTLLLCGLMTALAATTGISKFVYNHKAMQDNNRILFNELSNNNITQLTNDNPDLFPWAENNSITAIKALKKVESAHQHRINHGESLMEEINRLTQPSSSSSGSSFLSIFGKRQTNANADLSQSFVSPLGREAIELDENENKGERNNNQRPSSR